MNVSMRVTGLDVLQARLLELQSELAARALAAAGRRAFKPVLEAAKSLVPAHSGELRAAIRITVKKPSSGDTVVVVGLRITGGQGSDGNEAPPRRWHFVELGTVHMAAHPFMRPALDQNASVVVELLKEELGKGIERALRKHGRK